MLDHNVQWIVWIKVVEQILVQFIDAAVDPIVIIKLLNSNVEVFPIKNEPVRKMNLRVFSLLPFLKPYLKHVILYIYHQAQSQGGWASKIRCMTDTWSPSCQLRINFMRDFRTMTSHTHYSWLTVIYIIFIF